MGTTTTKKKPTATKRPLTRPLESRRELQTKWGMKTVDTPVGKFWLIARADRIWGAELEPRWPQLGEKLLAQYGIHVRHGETSGPNLPILQRAEEALRRYFNGDLEAPSKVDLDLEGSGLQKKVWSVVRRLGPGQTMTYKQLAAKVRQSGAFRAVGAANGANRCAIFVPCHRVLGTSGALHGYGGGIKVKAWLLKHEGLSNDAW